MGKKNIKCINCGSTTSVENSYTEELKLLVDKVSNELVNTPSGDVSNIVYCKGHLDGLNKALGLLNRSSEGETDMEAILEDSSKFDYNSDLKFLIDPSSLLDCAREFYTILCAMCHSSSEDIRFFHTYSFLNKYEGLLEKLDYVIGNTKLNGEKGLYSLFSKLLSIYCEVSDNGSTSECLDEVYKDYEEILLGGRLLVDLQ